MESVISWWNAAEYQPDDQETSAQIILVLIPVVIFSRRVTQPVLDNMEKQKQFITDAGHELKTPLTIISANVEVLELCNEENEWTNSIKNQVNRMSSLISNLLMLAKMDEMVEEEKQVVYFGKAVQAAAESFDVVASGKQISMENEIDVSAVVQGSPTRLNQLIMILIDNAVKYTEAGGAIRISCKKKKEKQILFSVWNSCEPMSNREITRLFDRFYRKDSSRSRQTGGYGIGLSAAQAIVRAHKGHISAGNQGKGICFTVQLPRFESQPDDMKEI